MQETMTRKKGRYMSRRFPAILIAFLMVCAMLPAEALADTGASPADAATSVVDTESISRGTMPEIPAFDSDVEADASLPPMTLEEGEQILPVTIAPAEGTAVVEGSGKCEALEDVYALTPAENDALTGGSEAENKEAILDYLLEDPCIVREPNCIGHVPADHQFILQLFRSE